MAQKHQYTTSDYLEWDAAMNLIRRLYKDGKIRLSLLVGCGCFFGLRFSDLSRLTWEQLLTGDSFAIYEQKTGKRREIRVNKGFQDFIRECYVALKIRDISHPCFLNRFGSIITNQMVNRHFKLIKVRYQIKTRNFSTHSLRKTFGRRVVDMAGPNAEMALIKLSEIFNHASPLVTRRYLGLRQEELGEVYEKLLF
ncbi:MAG: tyrosine-type recombinase/integrase [Bacteroidales bacterium]|nr:tyrosine-type recombinase/integrase [Bacteroidales bacterium]